MELLIPLVSSEEYKVPRVAWDLPKWRQQNLKSIVFISISTSIKMRIGLGHSPFFFFFSFYFIFVVAIFKFQVFRLFSPLEFQSVFILQTVSAAGGVKAKVNGNWRALTSLSATSAIQKDGKSRARMWHDVCHSHIYFPFYFLLSPLSFFVV